MAEWLTIRAAARAAGYSASGLCNMIWRGGMPREYVAHNGKGYVLDSSVIPWLIEHKQEWHAAIKQPDGVIHVPDPLGIQEGLWITPDEAQRLLAIRAYHRLYPNGKERNKAMRCDG